ncbi:hypothetical protein ACFRAO_32525 [Streptomyces sp. NPDC056656]|uniref:hypothetical protein n=1 Tax=Streptomyces sp. NPDC056656 TaxID=3345895 RepID=UPI0036869736
MTLPGFQARERGDADAGQSAHLVQRQPGGAAQHAHPGADLREQLRNLMALGDR